LNTVALTTDNKYKFDNLISRLDEMQFKLNDFGKTFEKLISKYNNELDNKVDHQEFNEIKNKFETNYYQFIESKKTNELFMITFNEKVISLINSEISKGILFSKKNISDILFITDDVAEKKDEVILRFIIEREEEMNLAIENKIKE